MPVPKSKQDQYGKIIGHLINLAKKKGMTKSKAKAYAKSKAEKWLKDTKKKKRKTK